ncbi:MAG: UDP-N-acetylmuramoyl-L-alanine--D-glutamate ligase [Bdellovibrionales bacterium]|nr:UDP-N-acetylmuramoyl-L-alanine--D-glutamate ligase [Bdellovibrionales bacterium]
MFNYKDIAGKNVMVVGLGRTGVSLSKFLVKQGANVTISDHKSKAELLNYLEKMDGVNVNYDLGGHTPKLFLQQDLIILSPGVSPQMKIFDYARSRGVKITGEFEFAAAWIEAPIIAVTGTNGKTTCCALIAEFFKASDIRCWVGGNYGNPLSDYLIKEDKEGVVVAEVSSFQLEHCEQFKPKNIVFTNLAENHLDRYKSMEDYVNAKRKIFLNTDQTITSVLNADDNAVVELARDPSVQRGRIFYFSRKPSLEPQIMNIGGAVLIKDEMRVRRGPEIEYFSVKNTKMKGAHSYENIMAAVIVTLEHGAKHEAIQRVIDNYTGIAHRLEYVRRVGGVEFFNDSKATNVHAVMRALDAFDDNVILIMGGKDTNLNYEPLRDRIKRKCKTLILVGEAKERINRDVGDYSETFLIGTFEEAVHIAYQKSRIGDLVLLSPGCSSFDVFENYIERGNYFKELVNSFN